MFQLYFINFDYADDRSFLKMSDAVKRAEHCGFECNIVEWGLTDTDQVVASWSPISGIRNVTNV